MAPTRELATQIFDECKKFATPAGARIFFSSCRPVPSPPVQQSLAPPVEHHDAAVHGRHMSPHMSPHTSPHMSPHMSPRMSLHMSVHTTMHMSTHLSTHRLFELHWKASMRKGVACQRKVRRVRALRALRCVRACTAAVRQPRLGSTAVLAKLRVRVLSAPRGLCTYGLCGYGLYSYGSL